MNKGKLYIIPVPISENTLDQVIPSPNKEIIASLRVFVVEKLKAARQFLRKSDPNFPIDDSVFFEQDKHAEYDFHPDLIQHLLEGKDVGLLSESGYPGVADPGSRIVAVAHEQGCEIVPLTGPSSILMALASSGMNGQGFTFHGYLPRQTNERIQKIKELLHQIQRTGYSQLFIETPYRNKSLFDDLLSQVSGDIKLCIAYDITGSDEKIVTKKIAAWKKHPFTFEKLPCVFVLGT